MSQLLRFIAIDDSQSDLLSIVEYTKNYPCLKNCGTFSNAVEGYEAIDKIKPDLIFLDIEMKGINGIDLLKKIRKQLSMAVFVTSHIEYALESYELSVLDYLLKPVTPERFARTVCKIKNYWEMKQRSDAYEILFDKEVLTIKEGHNQVRLFQRDIIYLEAMQDYTKIVTHHKNYMTLASLSFFMEQLPENRFIRVHRSYAVSLNQIKELRYSELLCDKMLIPVGKTYRSAIAKLRL